MFENTVYQSDDFIVYSCQNISQIKSIKSFPEKKDGAIISLRFTSPPTGKFTANKRKSSTVSNFLKIYKNLSQDGAREFLRDKSYDVSFIIIMKQDRIEDLGFSDSKIDLESIYLDLPEKMDEPAIKPMMLELYGFFSNAEFQEDFLFDQICNTIINHIIHAYWVNTHNTSSVRLPMIKRENIALTLDYIGKYLHETLPLKELAKRVHMSPYYFARAFKNTVGMPPHQYILMRRILKSQKLLKETDTSISEIAEKCGFHDQAHFNHKFKAWTGTTPRTYRKSKLAAQTEPEELMPKGAHKKSGSQ